MRKGHGAQNMALVRKFALNKLPPPPGWAGRTFPSKPAAGRQAAPPQKPQAAQKNRQWDVKCLAEILTGQTG